MKKALLFIFFTLAAITLGAGIAYLCDGVKYLNWLSWGKEFGFDNFAVDLYVVGFSLSINIKLTISQLITIPIGLLVYSKAAKSLG